MLHALCTMDAALWMLHYGCCTMDAALWMLHYGCCTIYGCCTMDAVLWSLIAIALAPPNPCMGINGAGKRPEAIPITIVIVSVE